MAEHYDPLYERSMKRHFAGLAGAPVVELADGGPAALARAARALAEQA
jgi:tRNA 2-selenouridine synthase